MEALCLVVLRNKRRASDRTRSCVQHSLSLLQQVPCRPLLLIFAVWLSLLNFRLACHDVPVLSMPRGTKTHQGEAVRCSLRSASSCVSMHLLMGTVVDACRLACWKLVLFKLLCPASCGSGCLLLLLAQLSGHFTPALMSSRLRKVLTVLPPEYAHLQRSLVSACIMVGG